MTRPTRRESAGTPAPRIALFAAIALLQGCTAFDPQAPAATPGAWTFPTSDIPLGPPGSPVSHRATPVADGITYHRIERGVASDTDFWTASVAFHVDKPAAQADLDQLTAAGFVARFDPSAGTRADGTPLGYWLSVGRFATQSAAAAQVASIATATHGRLAPRARYTGLNGFATTGPWLVNVLAIRPALASATMNSYLPLGDTAGTSDLGHLGETPSAAAARLNAWAATNGGFFTDVTPDKVRTHAKSPVGTYVFNGTYMIPPLGARSAVQFRNDGSGHPAVRILHGLTGEFRVEDAAGDGRAITGVDRPFLGYVVNCGAPAQVASPIPQQDHLCTNYDDLVLYDELYLKGQASNARIDPGYKGRTYQLQVDASGAVVSGAETLGAAPPKGGYVLQGLGAGAAWLQRHAVPGVHLKVSKKLLSDGAALVPRPTDSIVEAGPTLLSATVTPANILDHLAGEGFGFDYAGVNTANWYNAWVTARNARTAIGVAADGTILLVEIDGRKPIISLGTTIAETSAVMAWLGAVDAINLDGGGSSNMVVNGTLVGHPSDDTGERAVGNSVLVLPARP